MSQPPVCSFCLKKGIPLPHNHTIRNWSSKEKEIICPQLLSNACTYCGVLGHTKQYCLKLKEKEARLKKADSANPNTDEITGNKRMKISKNTSNKRSKY